MKYSHSEIFDSYAKIATERGLVSDKPLAKRAEEVNPRYDSQDISAIEALYGVKFPGQSDKDILDQAHPDSVLIAPSHDKVNGLVENLKERHNIMVGIALKPTNGLLTQHIYVAAQNQLLDELLKVGFLLDRKNETQLMSLADSCSERLVKVANPLLIGLLVAAGIGIIYTAISQNLHLSQGVVQDAEKALVELNEAISTYSEHGDLKTELAGLISKIKALKEIGEKVASIQMHPATESQSNNAVVAYAVLQNNKDIEAITLMSGFSLGCADLAKTLGDYISILKLKAQQYESANSDWLEPLRRGFRSIIPSDMEDAWGALEALQKSCTAAPSQMEAMINLFKELRTKGIQSLDQFKKKMEGSDLEPEKKPDPEVGKPQPPIKANPKVV